MRRQNAEWCDVRLKEEDGGNRIARRGMRENARRSIAAGQSARRTGQKQCCAMGGTGRSSCRGMAAREERGLTVKVRRSEVSKKMLYLDVTCSKSLAFAVLCRIFHTHPVGCAKQLGHSGLVDLGRRWGRLGDFEGPLGQI